MPKAKWKSMSEEELRNLVKKATSFQEIKRNLGYSESSGSATEILKKVFDELQIDYSHFKGHAWNKKDEIKNKSNRKRGSNLGLSPNYVKQQYLASHSYVCAECGISSWNGKSITLQLHHVDGDKTNNEESNLVLLCPNCHSQTENYCGKNNKKKVSDEIFLEVLQNEGNVCAACRALGISPNQSNYQRAKRLLNSKEAK